MNILFYIRVSTDDQKESLERYRLKAKEFCSMHKHNLIGIFADEDVSGGIELFKRPQGKKLYEELSKHKDVAIATPDISRLFRDLRDGVNTLYDLQDLDIPVYSADMFGQAVDINTYMGFGLIIDHLKYAHMERLRIKQRTLDAMKGRRKVGLLTSNIPYGYKLESDNSKRILPDEREMLVVKEIVSLSKQGIPFARIADKLNELNIPTKHNKTWHAITVSKIVKYQQEVG